MTPIDPTAVTWRRRAVLEAIVQEHVATARSVSSGTVAQEYELGVSSATVRHEMAALERMGLITQRHTSAGRVPSSSGYRFYVEYLMKEPRLSRAEQIEIACRFQPDDLALDQWLQLGATILAQGVHNAALVTAPRSETTVFKHLELIHVQDSLVLLVAVFEGGTVRQHMFVPEVHVSQDDLSLVAGRLNRSLRDGDPRGFLSPPGQAGTIERQVVGLVERVMQELDEAAAGDVFVEGLEHILSQPEFRGTPRASRSGEDAAENMIRMVQLVRQGLLIHDWLRRVSSVDGLQFIIGDDGQHEEMRQVGIVLSRYGDQHIGGFIGVLGPTRMHYGRAVAVVRYVGGILGEITSGRAGTGT